MGSNCVVKPRIVQYVRRGFSTTSQQMSLYVKFGESWRRIDAPFDDRPGSIAYDAPSDWC